MNDDSIAETIKAFLLQEFLPGEDSSALNLESPLITGGILDSIGTLKLVTFLEETYDVRFAAHEVNEENLDSLANILQALNEKLA